MRNLYMIAAAIFLIAGCEAEDGSLEFHDERMEHATELRVDQCADAPFSRTICLDSVVNDSRCPEDVVCVWAGNAEIYLSLTGTGDGVTHSLLLNTNPSFQNDTVIDLIRYEFVDLDPAPKSMEELKQRDYTVWIYITDLRTTTSPS